MRKTYLVWFVAFLFSYFISNGQAYKSNNGYLKEVAVAKESKKNVSEVQRMNQRAQETGNKHMLSFQRGKSNLECPGESLFANPLDGYANASTSESVLGYTVATSYFADGSIDSISFWSISAYNDGTAWSSCSNEIPTEFKVTFYQQGEDGVGDEYLAYESVEASSTATGEMFAEGFEIYQNTIVLPTSCDLTSGIVAITGISDNSCFFLWVDSPAGSGTGYQYDSEYSEWVVLETPLSICISGEPNKCLAPQNPEALNITTDAADLGWTEMNGAAKWQVSFSYLGDGTAQVSSTVIDVEENPYTVESLNIQSFYKFAARTVCAEGDTSLWSFPLKFRTSCGSVASFPFVENFDGDWNSWCWEVIDADVDGVTWNQNNIYLVPVLSGEYVAHGMGNQDDYLITPQLVLDAVYQMQWWDKVESATNNNTYEILVSTTGKEIADFTYNLGTFDCTNIEWVKHAIYLDQFEGQSIYIAIHQIYSASAWWGFGIEDVTISLKPDCVPVTDLLASDVTKTSAILSWIENGDATAWNLAYGPEGFDLSEGISVKVTENPYTLTGLTEGTYYEFYVQAACDNSDAEWVGPYMFATDCETGTDIVESFETRVAPLCWQNFENGDGIKTWEQSSWLVNTGDYAAMASYESSGGLNSKWLVTGRTIVPTGKALAFYATDYLSSDYGSTLSIKISTDADFSNTAAYTNLLTLSESDVTNYVFSQTSIDLADYAGQEVFIAFVMEDNDGDNWFLDDVAFITCPSPSNLEATNITTTSADLIWVSSAASFAVEYGVAGFELGQGTEVKPTATSYLVTGLEADTYYDFYVKAYCSDVDESSWAGPYTFKTENLPCTTISEFPYSEGFEGLEEFDCWTAMYNTASDGGLDGTNLVTPPTANTWFVMTPESFDGNGSYYIYEGTRAAGLGYTAPDFNWLISPEIQVPTAGAEFSFMLWLKDSVEVNWVTKFHVNVFDGTSWSTVLSYGDGSTDNEYEEPVVISLDEYAGTIIKVALVYEFNDGYELAVDNISIISEGGESNETAILSYTLPNGTTTLDAANHKVDVTVPTGTDVSALVAIYTLSAGATVKVGSTVQESGVTVNNFTAPVVYTVVAEDGTTIQDWTVTVSVLPGVHEGLQANVNVYPNPTNGNFIIEGNFETRTIATILDLTGKVIVSMELNNVKNNVDLRAFESGLYFIELVSGDQKAMFKIFKQ